MSWDPYLGRCAKAAWLGKYPPEELIGFVARRFYSRSSRSDRSAAHILEVGCGVGANLWCLSGEGFSAHGIDGSPSAIARATEWMQEEGWCCQTVVGDIADLDWHFSKAFFDAVIDVAALQHNTLADLPVSSSRSGRC
jgi:2-polyprenyl-3-methyl-5-hydroxy-6-metoxy-1,4-benzoquinol methylase